MKKAVDSYQEFIDYFHISKDDLYMYGLSAVISVDEKTATEQYHIIKEKLLGNEELYIRGYGRNGINTRLYLDLYNMLFDNNKIKIDPTNNMVPRRNISKNTGHKINEDILNYQVSHIWGKTKNPILFESVWNICFIPRLYDPFTGHECKGGWNEEFTVLLNHYIYDKYESIISDYNQFLSDNDIKNKINSFVDLQIKQNQYDISTLERFKNDAPNEWEIIKRL